MLCGVPFCERLKSPARISNSVLASFVRFPKGNPSARSHHALSAVEVAKRHTTQPHSIMISE